MRLGAIVFSRFTSSRLPGKALIDIGGRPLLGRVIDRVKGIAGIERIVVATSSEDADDVIAQFAEAEGIDCYRGELYDVAARAVGACEAFGLDAFSRICGDRPFLDPDIDRQLIELFEEHDLDMATTTGERKLPPGLTGEVVRASSLKKLLPALSAYEREHVTACFYAGTGPFRIKSLPTPDYVTPETKVRLVVDDETDLARARAILSEADSDSGEPDMFEIISLAERWDREHRNSPPIATQHRHW